MIDKEMFLQEEHNNVKGLSMRIISWLIDTQPL